MKVGDDKELTLTTRLTGSATHWKWKDHNLAKKEEQFKLYVRVDRRIEQEKRCQLF